MIIWVIGMVKNESDLIGHNLDHLFSEGIHGATFLNNLSEDDTSEVLLSHGAEVITDPVLAYRQSEKMTELAHFVADKHGADWIIPVDADEIWSSTISDQDKSFTIYETLSSISENIVIAKVFNHFATGEDAINKNPFLRMPWKWSTAFGPKIAVRYDKSLKIGFGNHTATRNCAKINDEVLQVRHFPYRSLEHLKFKITQGSAALKAAGVKTAWTNYYDAWMKEGDSCINEIWSNFYFPNPSNEPQMTLSGFHKFHEGQLVYDPAPIFHS
jgi:hypothetical protein